MENLRQISSVMQIKTTEAARNKVPWSTRSTTKKVVLNMKAIADESKKIFLAPNLFIMWPREFLMKEANDWPASGRACSRACDHKRASR